MRKICYGVIALSLLLCSVTSATAQISIGIGLPNVSIGINLPLFPELVRVPGYPVYYAPRLNANYFFYDGMYWVYQDDYWYASSWYNGPWAMVGPEVVPLFILRIPVRYYRQPPAYFRGWQPNAPPRWGQHWGRDWEQHRSGWDRWQRGSAPAPAPLPVYQRQYTGDRYPRVDQQPVLRNQQYRYQPREEAVRQHYKQQVEHEAPAPVQPVRKQEAAPARSPKQPDVQRSAPPQRVAPALPPAPIAPPVRKLEPVIKSPKQPDASQPAPRQLGAPPGRDSQPPKRGGEQVQKTAPPQPAQQQRGPAIQEQKKPEPAKQEQKQQPGPAVKEQKQQPAAVQHQQQAPKPQQTQKPQQQENKAQDKGDSKEPKRGQGQGQRDDDERGQGRNK